jgi:2,4-dienoyl-CoA reductase-like NADH-dependent reductase (Old Yellow Enzyme family)
LLNQFLSPATNHREDEYGGSLENRMRIVMRIIDAAREEVGSDAIVGLRLNSDDGMQGGLGMQCVSEKAVCAVVERDTSFVAGGFNTEDQHDVPKNLPESAL